MGYREFKLEVPSLTNIQLKLVFIFHFIFISWATLHPWATQAYIIHGLIYLFLLIWTIVQDGVEQVLLCLGVNLASIILDIIIISIFFPSYKYFKNTSAEFSGVMAIFNLILRVYSCYVLYMEWCGRSGAGGVAVVDAGGPATVYEGGAVRSASVLAHYPGGQNSPRMQPGDQSGLPAIPASFTVVN